MINKTKEGRNRREAEPVVTEVRGSLKGRSTRKGKGGKGKRPGVARRGGQVAVAVAGET